MKDNQKKLEINKQNKESMEDDIEVIETKENDKVNELNIKDSTEQTKIDEVKNKAVEIIEEVKKTEEIEEVKVVKTKKIELDEFLENSKDLKSAIEIYQRARKALKKEEISKQDLKYIEQQIKEKYFSDSKYEDLNTNILMKIAKYSKEVEKFNIDDIRLIDFGIQQREKSMNEFLYMYNGQFISLFGVDINNDNKIRTYDFKKYIRQEFLQAVRECIKAEKIKIYKKSKLPLDDIEQDIKKIRIQQYEDYFVVFDEQGIQIYREKPIVALVAVEHATFDKIKNKLSCIFKINLFKNKNQKYLPNMIKIYDDNKFKEVDEKELNSKEDAKNRMKSVLLQDRVATRTNEE